MANSIATNLRATRIVARLRCPRSSSRAYNCANGSFQRGASLAASINTCCSCGLALLRQRAALGLARRFVEPRAEPAIAHRAIDRAKARRVADLDGPGERRDRPDARNRLQPRDALAQQRMLEQAFLHQPRELRGILQPTAARRQHQQVGLARSQTIEKAVKVAFAMKFGLGVGFAEFHHPGRDAVLVPGRLFDQSSAKA